MVTIDLINILIQCGLKAPSADNSQPWHFEWNGTALSVQYDTARVAGRTFPANSPATLLSLGTVIENIIEISTYYNLSTEVSWNPETLSTTSCNVKFSFQCPNTPDLISPYVNHPVFKRHTNRFPYHKTTLPKPVIDSLSHLKESCARLHIFDSQKPIREIARFIKIASEIRFQTKEVHEWLGECLRFTKEDVKKADGLDIRTLDLPPGGSMFLKLISSWHRMKVLNRVGMYHLLAQIDAAPIKAAPAIVALIAPATPQGALDAGRLLCRSWAYLNEQGIAVHPYYVVADQLARLEAGLIPEKLTPQVTSLKRDCTETFSITEGETLHMLMRIGYPKRNNPPKSLRLPEHVVFSDHSKQ